MKIEFTNGKINEYANGNLYFQNTGEAFEVSPAVAEDLLNAKHSLNGQFVHIFRPADKEARIAEAEMTETKYPDGFPNADLLIKAGYSPADAALLTREQLIAIKGIGEKSADAIIEFIQE